MSKYNNLFIYQGSKINMLTHLIKDDILPKNGNILVEPFLGSCSLLLNTNYNKYYFNDLNKEIFDFINILLNIDLTILEKSYDDLVCKFYYGGDDENIIIEKKDFYYSCRNYFFSEYEKLSDLKKASLFCFLTYNGFGGKALNKNITCGRIFRKPPLRVEVYKQFQMKKDKIKIFNLDYKDFISEVLKQEKQEEIIIYFDPPYINSFKYQKDNILDDFVKEIKEYYISYNFKKTIKSNYKSNDILELFKEYKIFEIDRCLNLQTKNITDKTKTELIIIKGEVK